MPVRVKWENQYALAIRTGTISASSAATTGLWIAGDKGPGGSGLCGLLIDDSPSIDPGVEVVQTDKSTGLSQPKTGASNVMGVELAIVKQAPKVSLGSMGLTPEKLEMFSWALFQKGALAETGAGPYTKVFEPYVYGQADPECYLDFGASIGAPSAGAFGQAMTGAICNQLSVKGAQGERMVLSAELMGASYRTNYDHAASVFTSEGTADKSFLDFAWTIDATAASLQSVELTIANNAVALHYNSILPTAYTLHRIDTTGTLSLAMSTTTLGDYAQVTKFTGGTAVKLVGTATGGSIIFETTCRYTGASIDAAETELLVNLPFQGVRSDANQSIKITCISANSLGIV